MNLDLVEKYLPQIIISISIFIEIFFSIFKINISKKINDFIAISGLILSAYFLINTGTLPNHFYISAFQSLICLTGIVILFFKSNRIFKKDFLEFNILLLSGILFSLFIVDSSDFLSLYINIELLSLVTYFLISFDKKLSTTKESLKYLITNSIASALFLSGFAVIYGLTGSIEFSGIINRINNLKADYTTSTFLIPYTLIITGLCFKLGIFPIANWLIDIYKKSDSKIVLFISTIPKILILGSFVSILNYTNWLELTLIISIFALLTAFWGCYYSIKCNNLKILMAISSYINISYILIAIGFYTKFSLSTALFYTITYVISNIGAWAGISVLEHSNFHNKDFNFNGYLYKNPIFSINFALCIISLLGFPITSGFIAKIYLISGILNSGILSVPILFFMFVTMILSIYFYLNILRKMFVVENNTLKSINTSVVQNKVTLYTMSILTLLIGLFPTQIINFCISLASYIT